VKLVDANVLIYAVDESVPHHAAALSWFDGALSGIEPVLLPWVSLLAFVRISTHPRLSRSPLTVDSAFDIVDAWLSADATVVPQASPAVSRRMRGLLDATGRGGNLVNDAFLAALALENRAEVVSFDNDFDRFPGVRRIQPGPGRTDRPPLGQWTP
jgi:toxin-antitoxin system PIN domain toxin